MVDMTIVTRLLLIFTVQGNTTALPIHTRESPVSSVWAVVNERFLPVRLVTIMMWLPSHMPGGSESWFRSPGAATRRSRGTGSKSLVSRYVIL